MVVMAEHQDQHLNASPSYAVQIADVGCVYSITT